MSTEKLIVELDAKTAKLDAKLKASKSNLNDLEGATDSVDRKMVALSTTARTVGSALGVATVAVGALTAGTVALISKTTEYAKELKIASQISGIATEQLEGMAFATSTVGINIEKLGDISKDTLEKVGDFLNTGGGGFQDFADAMKLTKDEAKELAAEFSSLTGPEVLQRMVSMMEEADVSAVQMSHALEGMASDTTNLIPLLANSGEKMRELSNAMADVTVPLTDSDIQKLTDLNEALKLAGESASSLANQTLIDLSDWFTNAANSATFFFSSLNEGTRSNLQVKLLENIEAVKEIEEAMKNAETVSGRLWNTLTFNTSQDKFNQEKINELLNERKEIEAELAALNKSDILPPEKIESEKKDPLSGDGGINEDAISAIEDRFKTEEELLRQKLEKELEIVGENNELRLALEEEYLENLLNLQLKADEEAAQAKDKQEKDREKRQNKLDREKAKQKKVEDKIAKDNQVRDKQAADAAISVASMVFEDNKAVSAGIAAVNTARAITEVMPNYAMAAVVAATGAAQIAAILGASKGGGSAPTVAAQPPQQEEFTPETSTLDVTEQDAGGGTQTMRVIISDDSGNDYLDAIANGLTERQVNGA